MNALGCHVVFVFQDAEQQVLRSDDGALENFGFQIGDFQNLLGLLDQGDVARATGLGATGPDRAFHEFAELLQVAIQPLKDAHSGAFSFFDDAQQQVFHPDVVVAQAKGLFTTQRNHLAHPC